MHAEYHLWQTEVVELQMSSHINVLETSELLLFLFLLFQQGCLQAMRALSGPVTPVIGPFPRGELLRLPSLAMRSASL